MHIGLILDGNRRFATAAGKKTWEGHSDGAKTFDKVLSWLDKKDVTAVTAYVLSTENLTRSKIELEALFSLLRTYCDRLLKSSELKDKNVKMQFIGDLAKMPADLAQKMQELMTKTQSHTRRVLTLAVAYGGRDELVRAVNKILLQKVQSVDEQSFAHYLDLQSDPDLVIRTGGHIRTSNFLPWQTTYSEWFFLDKMWPEVTEKDIDDVLSQFATRKRNFGK